jgi:hypothetical protein
MSNNNIYYDFKYALVTILKTIISEDSIYNTLPLQDVEYPFLTYEAKKIPKTPGCIFNVVIDIWDNRTDTTRLEMLTDEISNVLDYISYNDDNILLRSYETLTQDVPTQEESINRRQVLAEISTYKK